MRNGEMKNAWPKQLRYKEMKGTGVKGSEKADVASSWDILNIPPGMGIPPKPSGNASLNHKLG